MRRPLQGLLLAAAVAATIATRANTTPLDRLGRVTQWFLVFARDPYAEVLDELKNDPPEIAAQALMKAVEFPSDGDAKEMELLARFEKVPASTLPHSLADAVRSEFESWKKSHGSSRLKLEISASRAATELTIPWREGKRVHVPVAAIGRDLVRAVRDEGGLFRIFMWTLSHPTYARTRATRSSDVFELTGGCLEPLPGEPKNPCGGSAYYRAHDTDIDQACGAVEARFRNALRATFDTAYSDPTKKEN